MHLNIHLSDKTIKDFQFTFTGKQFFCFLFLCLQHTQKVVIEKYQVWMVFVQYRHNPSKYSYWSILKGRAQLL